jgi:UDP-N-acetylglucosamine 2-epimerase
MRRVVLSGDVMLDNSLYFAQIAEEKCGILTQHGLLSKQFLLATIHRNDNTDTPERLTSIFEALLSLAAENKIVLPLHPRTKKMLPLSLSKELYDRVLGCENIMLLPPASFFEIIMLEKHARLVLTDSGGVQKEAYFYHTPCVIMRPETEWVEIVNAGAGILADADRERIVSSAKALMSFEGDFPSLFGDGHAAEHILETIVGRQGCAALA